MNYRITHKGNFPAYRKIRITGSKSESNRILVLKKLFNPKLCISNLSNSDDTQFLQRALEDSHGTINIHHAGTAMRFLTSFYTIRAKGSVYLTGSDRMKQRPISILVGALNSIGAKISYADKVGFPPLIIERTSKLSEELSIKANISSQYITSLMLIGAALPNGLTIKLIGKITSRPYIQLSLVTLKLFGIEVEFVENLIRIHPISYNKLEHWTVESDWSSASYYYSILSLVSSHDSSLGLNSFRKNSAQGDLRLTEIYKQLGISSYFDEGDSLRLNKVKSSEASSRALSLDLIENPDLAQTIVVNAFGLALECQLFGLHTLKIKETDRLVALKNELTKLGAEIEITNNSLHLKRRTSRINPDIEIETYQDHRMAMAFAPLALITPIKIKQTDVVSKSYPHFWKDIESLGFELNRYN